MSPASGQRSRWREVTSGAPCPACGKPDWCAWSDDGWLKCERDGTAPSGYIATDSKGSGTLFRPEGANTPHTASSKQRPRNGAWGHGTFDAFGIFKTFESARAHQTKLVNAVNPLKLAALAGQLHVTSGALVGIGVGWDGSEWTFPEQGCDRQITGFQRRSLMGKKSQIKGGHRGLILPGSQPPGQILLVEGPSDVAACLTMGLPAIGRPSNTGGVAHLVHLMDRGVMVIGENDQKKDGRWPGRDGALKTAEALACAWDQTVHWAMVPAGFKDIRGWLVAQCEAGLDLSDPAACAIAGRALLAQLVRQPRVGGDDGLVVTRMSEVEIKQVEWLWPERIPAAMLTLIAGDPGLGKSTIALYIAAMLTRGLAMVGGGPATTGEVIWLTSEDDVSRVLKPKLLAAGADMEKVHVVEGIRSGQSDDPFPFSLDVDLPKLERFIVNSPSVRLVVIDPLLSFMGEADYIHHQEVRKVLAAVKAMSERRGVTVIGIMHLNKSMGGTVLQRLTGSMAFGAAARAVWLVCSHPEDAERRLLLCAKLSVAKVPTGLEFALAGDPPCVQWSEEPVTITAHDALNPPVRTELKESKCVRWLRDYLGEGPVKSTQIYTDGADAGFSSGQLQRAKDALDAGAFKHGLQSWWWGLPGHSGPVELVGHEPFEDPEDLEDPEAKLAASTSRSITRPALPSPHVQPVIV